MRSNLAVRVLTAVVAVPFLLYLLLWAPSWGFIALLLAACLIGAIELFGMTMRDQPLLRAWGVAATLLQFGIMISPRDPLLSAASVPVLVIAAMVLGLSRPAPVDKAASRIAWLIAGPLYIGATLGALGLLFLGKHGGYWVVLAALITWLGDTGAYFGGRAFGKHKLYETVSPNKTVEGAGAGLLGSVAGVLIAHFWFLPQLPLLNGVALALFGGMVGQLGDLCESLIKRGCGVKDSGWIVPGHGGILDRIDALLFVSPVVWFYVQWLQG